MKKMAISSAAVQKATGKAWNEWHEVLDAAGGKKMTHKEIVAVLAKQHDVGPWWQQMVTVGYEQARGLRVKHQRPDGFSINRSKTIAAAIEAAFSAWHDKRTRRKWLEDPDFMIRKATANTSLRITWGDGAGNLDVQFYPKGKGKCQVTIEHARLKSAKHAEKMKAYWGEQLDALRAFLES
ncbi:MAG: SRPBCC domain-containing protein [Planctomycetes bacterium]|nr:SRPBCC domain-containing protein [Planctomycetota bacterium]